jgi:hypothetical protein
MTFLKAVLPTFISWFCPAFWWQDSNMNIFFSAFTSTLISLQASFKISVSFLFKNTHRIFHPNLCYCRDFWVSALYLNPNILKWIEHFRNFAFFRLNLNFFSNGRKWISAIPSSDMRTGPDHPGPVTSDSGPHPENQQSQVCSRTSWNLLYNFMPQFRGGDKYAAAFDLMSVLNSWSKVLHKKLAVAQLVKIFPLFSEPPDFITVLARACFLSKYFPATRIYLQITRGISKVIFKLLS